MDMVHDKLYNRDVCWIRGVVTDIVKRDAWYCVDVKTLTGEALTLNINPRASVYAFAPDYWFSVKFFPNKSQRDYEYDHITDLRLYYTRDDLVANQNEIHMGNADDEMTFLKTEKNTVKWFTRAGVVKGTKAKSFGGYKK